MRDYAGLSAAQKGKFKEAITDWVDDLKNGRTPRPALGIEGFKSRPGVFEFHFAGFGRATFQFGPEIIPGEPHIIWRRCGIGHGIYDKP